MTAFPRKNSSSSSGRSSSQLHFVTWLSAVAKIKSICTQQRHGKTFPTQTHVHMHTFPHTHAYTSYSGGHQWVEWHTRVRYPRAADDKTIPHPHNPQQPPPPAITPQPPLPSLLRPPPALKQTWIGPLWAKTPAGVNSSINKYLMLALVCGNKWSQCVCERERFRHYSLHKLSTRLFCVL